VDRSIIRVSTGRPIGALHRGSTMCTSTTVWSISTICNGPSALSTAHGFASVAQFASDRSKEQIGVQPRLLQSAAHGSAPGWAQSARLGDGGDHREQIIRAGTRAVFERLLDLVSDQGLQVGMELGYRVHGPGMLRKEGRGRVQRRETLELAAQWPVADPQPPRRLAARVRREVAGIQQCADLSLFVPGARPDRRGVIRDRLAGAGRTP
jgi:hypothetical protein